MIAEAALETRQRFINDFQRPRYHFLPPSNWMNDPNGFIHWQGQYHLFYQYNPHGAYWADMHWGHAVSPDLIHWSDLPIALAPTPGGADETGVFSGCAVDHDGVPTILYTSAAGERFDIQTQSIATSRDGLLTWEKHAGNPVLSVVPPESGQTADFRDPFVWREDDGWYMALGSQIKGVGGAVFLYRSQNLIDWEYLNPLFIGDRKRNGVVWECPNFFKVDDCWVLIVSAHTGATTGEVLYFVGDYQNHRFTPSYEDVFDYAHLYAPLSTLDGAGRRVLMGWLRESRSDVDQRRAGWSGVQSIPRLMSLDARQRLIQTPIPELHSLRGQHYHTDSLALDGKTPLDARGLHLDIEAEFDLTAEGTCGIALAASAHNAERIEIVYECAQQRLLIHRLTYEGGHALIRHTREMPHALDDGEPLRLRILLDGSVVETIANGRTSVTSRVYPAQAEDDHVYLTGAGATLRALDIWQMPSIWL